MFMSEAIRPSAWPYSDSAAPDAVAGEKDACGVGFLAQLSGKSSHWVLQQALRGLGCMEHRGGCGGDGDSGDGAGILCGIPWNYLRAVWPEASAAKGLGMMFMPTNPASRAAVRACCDAEAKALGLSPLGWREVPIDPSVLGELARQTAPAIEQWALMERMMEMPLKLSYFAFAGELVLGRVRSWAPTKFKTFMSPP
jgi:glutamate synthase (ferredoxin)